MILSDMELCPFLERLFQHLQTNGVQIWQFKKFSEGFVKNQITGLHLGHFLIKWVQHRCWRALFFYKKFSRTTFVSVSMFENNKIINVNFIDRETKK